MKNLISQQGRVTVNGANGSVPTGTTASLPDPANRFTEAEARKISAGAWLAKSDRFYRVEVQKP